MTPNVVESSDKKCSSCGRTKGSQMFSTGKVTCDYCRSRKQKERKILLEQRQSKDQRVKGEIHSTKMLVEFLQTQLDVRNQQVVDLVSQVASLHAELATFKAPRARAGPNSERPSAPAAKRRKMATHSHQHGTIHHSAADAPLPSLADVMDAFPHDHLLDYEMICPSSSNSDTSLLSGLTYSGVLTSGSEQDETLMQSQLQQMEDSVQQMQSMTHLRAQPADNASRHMCHMGLLDQGKMPTFVTRNDLLSFII